MPVIHHYIANFESFSLHGTQLLLSFYQKLVQYQLLTEDLMAYVITIHGY